jgi:transcriptional antiterminator RfaH
MLLGRWLRGEAIKGVRVSKRWHVGVSRISQETVAKRELENQGFDVYLPLCIKEWTKKPRIKPFLPSYLFIGIDTENQRWRSVFSTFGMRTVLCSGDKPQAIPDWIVDGIMAREVDGLVRLPPPLQCKFLKGDKLAIKKSPLEVVFAEVKDNKRAEVFVSLLGRQFKNVVPISRLYSSPVAAG